MTDLFQSIVIIFLAVSTIFNIVAIGGLRKRIYGLQVMLMEWENALTGRSFETMRHNDEKGTQV